MSDKRAIIIENITLHIQYYASQNIIYKTYTHTHTINIHVYKNKWKQIKQKYIHIIIQ